MHFFAFEDRSRQFRRKSENIFRILNKAVWAIHLSCALIGIILLVVAAEDMFTESPMAAGASLSLQARYTAFFSNCTTTATTDSFLLKSVPYTIDSGNIEFLLALYSSKVTQAIIIAAFSIIVSLVNKMVYDFNLFFWHKNSLIIRKDIISTLDIVFLCASIAANAIANELAAPLENHVKVCSGGTAISGTKNFLKASNFIPLYLAAALPLFLHLVCFIMLFINTVVYDKVDDPPTKEEETMDHQEGDEPLPDATKTAPPEKLANILQEEKILNRQKQERDQRRSGVTGAGADGAENVVPRIENRPTEGGGGQAGGNQQQNQSAVEGLMDSPSRQQSQASQPNANQQQQGQGQEPNREPPGLASLRALKFISGIRANINQQQQQQPSQSGDPNSRFSAPSAAAGSPNRNNNY